MSSIYFLLLRHVHIRSFHFCCLFHIEFQTKPKLDYWPHHCLESDCIMMMVFLLSYWCTGHCSVNYTPGLVIYMLQTGCPTTLSVNGWQHEGRLSYHTQCEWMATWGQGVLPHTVWMNGNMRVGYPTTHSVNGWQHESRFSYYTVWMDATWGWAVLPHTVWMDGNMRVGCPTTNNNNNVRFL